MVLILVSTIPTGIIGFVGKDVVEQASELLIVPGICLIATAILLFIADRCKGGDKLPKDITYTNAFVVGIAQERGNFAWTIPQRNNDHSMSAQRI